MALELGWTGGTPQTFDLFAKALAAGDFNDDGYDDLAVGVPGEEVNVANAGVVCVLYGSAAGLASAGQQWWSQNSVDVPGVAEAGDRLGESLATGDFDGDGFDDLAIGVPDEEVSGQRFAGAVNVLYGSSNGLSGSGSDRWTDPLGGIRRCGVRLGPRRRRPRWRWPRRGPPSARLTWPSGELIGQAR